MLLERMVARGSVCLRRLAGGGHGEEMRYGRFLANPRVTVERLLDGWGEQARAAAAGRHVLAIQDTSEINFRTTAERRRGLGEIGKGTGRGVLLHAMLALDAATGGCLGLVGGRIWTRQGRITVPHARRALGDKESERWLSTALTARSVLAEAATVTVIADRESDIYAEWATLPGPGFHLITRVMHDRRLADGGTLYQAGARLPVAGRAVLELRDRGPSRPARQAALELRFGPVALRRPAGSANRGLAKSVGLALVEVVEPDPPAGVEAVHWRLLTTHDVGDPEAAWRIVEWYRRRWTIEQLFRLLKTQGLQLEDSQLETADRLLKLAAIATAAATVTLQLLQARDGSSAEPASLAFAPPEIHALDALAVRFPARTARQANPHPRHSLAWAAWIIARLGGWNGYPRAKPPGPITFKHGLDFFHAFAAGWAARDV